MVEDEEIRKRIDNAVKYIGKPDLLRTERNDVYSSWKNYETRKIDADFNFWVMHYFILHGKV